MEYAKHRDVLRLPGTESTRLGGAARQPSYRTEPVRACGAICWKHRGNLRFSTLCGLLCLLLLTAACGAHQDGGTPPSPQQHLQEIMNNPHVPPGIKEAAQRQAQGQQGGGVQTPPRAGTSK